jgi:hypothetical protein
MRYAKKRNKNKKNKKIKKQTRTPRSKGMLDGNLLISTAAMT